MPSAAPTAPSTDWYDHPAWYDILHTPGTAEEVDGLERIRRRFGAAARPRARSARRPELWFEPGCGTGRYLRVLAARGTAVAGIDLNPAMIQYVREVFARRGLKGTLIAGDMARPIRGLDAGSVDFAFCLINSIRHLPTDAAMLAHLRVVARLLRPGGVYAVGISLTSYGHEFPSEDVWEGVRGSTRVTQLVQYLPPGETDGRPRAERVLSHLAVRTAGAEHHLDTVYDLRTYSGPQFEALLKKSPFKVVGVVDEAGRDALQLAGDQWKHPHATGYAIYVLGSR